MPAKQGGAYAEYNGDLWKIKEKKRNFDETGNIMESLALTINLVLVGIYTVLLGMLSLSEARYGKKVSKEFKKAA